MKFYLMTDLEGVAGITQWDDTTDERPSAQERRERERRWLAGEVSAAVDGFFAGGATEVLVNDGHGAGCTLDLDHVDPRARVLTGLGRPQWLPWLDATCGATGLVGAHSQAETREGCLYHTMDHLAIREWRFNGLALGEMGLQAAIAGHFGVPFVFVSGDAWACRELEELIPGVVTVPVKTGAGRNCALTCTPQEARRRIREGAEVALGRVGGVAPFRLESPIHFREARYPAAFDSESPPAGWTVLSPHVREAEFTDILDFMHGIFGFQRDWRPLEFTPAWQQREDSD